MSGLSRHSHNTEDCQTREVNRVIRVHMRQENAVNIGHRQACLGQLSTNACSSINNIDPILYSDSGRYPSSWWGPLPPNRTARSPERHHREVIFTHKSLDHLFMHLGAF